jgi:hypothetical protein
MGIPILGDIIKEVGNVVREVVPDADKRMEIELKFAELADRVDARENELLLGQIEVNKEEAKSANLFVAGWRPFIGWVSGVALAYTWVASPLLKAIFGLTDLPALDPDSIFPVVTAMLGIAGMRTFEKTKGVATSVGGRVLQPTPSTPQTQESQPKVQASKSSKGWFK